MVYTKQVWHDSPATDTPLSATRLGHIEDGIDALNNISALADAITSGESTLSRKQISVSTVPTSNQMLRLTYFTAGKTETISSVRVPSGGTGAVGTTLARIGVYSADGSGNLTLVASTPNDTSLWVTPNTAYTKALSASFSKTAGIRYAVGILVDGTSTAPTLLGQTSLIGSEGAIAPRVTGLRQSQTDLPGSITAASLEAQNHMAYAVLLP